MKGNVTVEPKNDEDCNFQGDNIVRLEICTQNWGLEELNNNIYKKYRRFS